MYGKLPTPKSIAAKCRLEVSAGTCEWRAIKTSQRVTDPRMSSTKNKTEVLPWEAALQPPENSLGLIPGVLGTKDGTRRRGSKILRLSTEPIYLTFRAKTKVTETLPAKRTYTERCLNEASKVRNQYWNRQAAAQFFRSDYFNQISWVLLPCETQSISYALGLKGKVFLTSFFLEWHWAFFHTEVYTDPQ